MKIIITVFLGCLLIGCGSKSEENNDDASGAILEYQLESLEKAQGVEKLLSDAEEKRKKAMEKQGI